MPEPGDIRSQIREAIEHLEHVLPGQAPIKDFVHHNTLHGYQHLRFPEALAQAHRVTGAYGYLPADTFRELLRKGRITREGLVSVLDKDQKLAASETLFESRSGRVTRGDVYLAALLHPIKPLGGGQLDWQIEELSALQSFQTDVVPEIRKHLLTAAGTGEPEAIEELWKAVLTSLDLEYPSPHPEELLDLSPDRADEMLAEIVSEEDHGTSRPVARLHLQRDAVEELLTLLSRVGDDLTLRDLLLILSGRDLFEDLRPYLIRHLSNYLDQGIASWHHRDREKGFFAAWRRSAENSLTWVFEELSDWMHHMESLPDDPLEVVVEELKRLDLPRARWIGYLERLALELPGWSGMFLWRHQHPGYRDQRYPVSMLDYLAVRLAMERLFARRYCAELWKIPPSLDIIRWYFRKHPAEFLVRHALFTGQLPEYLASRSQRLVTLHDAGNQDDEQLQGRWTRMAHLVWTWQQTPASERTENYSINRHAWSLFRLAQHLGLAARDIRSLNIAQIDAIFDCLETLDDDTAGYIWLRAYENHYRDQIFTALVQNHGRGRWSSRPQPPEAQIVFCMDDREEGIRRHLEELNPAIETLGAAGFFGVAINWRGLDDNEVTPLCPVVVVPSHEVSERPMSGHEDQMSRHTRRWELRRKIENLVHQDLRRNLLSSAFGIAATAPITLAALAAKILSPLKFGWFVNRLKDRFDPRVATAISINATDGAGPATPEHNRLGFTDTEQADRVEGFLRTIGLTGGFAPVVVLMGHGSTSQNNPHRAAYDCGACSGRHGGPNARVFAAMANRPEVRALLAQRGLPIPNDSVFVGTFHNTCDESIEWYDEDKLPKQCLPALARLKLQLTESTYGSAHERSRKFFSAPPRASRVRALGHIQSRNLDISQARPELGHATNACALIGRRSVSRGAFFDRRMFLISYDPTGDPEGKILENILLNAGPVGAGINLEYYFSTVNNEQYGCGSKVTHNVTGFLGVMEGTTSDLRTGLPLQMIEIHEAMRLQVIVEAKTDVLSAIYQRQPPLQELIGNGWLLLSAKDPDSASIHVFDPAKGWERCQGDANPLPTVSNSAAYYPGTMEPREPVLIGEPEMRNAV